jgi:hypothetical protein
MEPTVAASVVADDSFHSAFERGAFERWHLEPRRDYERAERLSFLKVFEAKRRL